MRRWTVAALVLVVAALAALWIDTGALREARAAHEAEDDAGALRLLEPGPLPLSATALYSRGLVHHGAGQHAEALATWRASYQLDPRSVPLIEALGLAREAAEGAAPPARTAPAWAALLTPGELGLIAVVLWAACGVLLSLRRPQPPTKGHLLIAAAAVALSLAALHGRQLAQQPIGVTLTATTARDAPSLDASLRHGIPPMSEVRVIRRAGLFALVVDGDDQRGWVPLDALAMPPAAH